MSKGINPFKGTKSVAHAAGEAPTLDLDPTGGLEHEIELPKPEDSTGVPRGSIREVLKWVGGDKQRAKLAIQAEESGSKRKTLLSELRERL